MKFKARSVIQQNTGPMADLAFMLLFFFLVTSDIKEEAGIPIQLPPKDAVVGSAKKVVNIVLNGNNEVMMNNESMSIDDCREMVKAQILSADDVSICLKTSQKSNYNAYLSLYDAVRSAYIMLYDDVSKATYGTSFNLLTDQQKHEIRKKRPMRIMETEDAAMPVLTQ